MVTIREGKMRDCKDLLTVYQTTRWYYRTKEGGYQTVEEIKQEHKGECFKRWGWFVAEEAGNVIGEIVVRAEKSPLFGRVGIIRNLDIDVRYQKKHIGTELTRTAEGILKKKKVNRITLLTPPEAYNFWMKVDYFARGSLLHIRTTPSKIKKKTLRGIKMVQLKDITKIPAPLKFSNIAVPGQLCDHAREIIHDGKKGSFYEVQADGKAAGFGMILKDSKDSGRIALDVMPKIMEAFPSILSKLLIACNTMKIKKITGVIPKDQLQLYNESARWSSEDAREIPVTRII